MISNPRFHRRDQTAQERTRNHTSANELLVNKQRAKVHEAGQHDYPQTTTTPTLQNLRDPRQIPCRFRPSAIIAALIKHSGARVTGWLRACRRVVSVCFSRDKESPLGDRCSCPALLMVMVFNWIGIEFRLNLNVERLRAIYVQSRTSLSRYNWCEIRLMWLKRYYKNKITVRKYIIKISLIKKNVIK